MSIEYSSYILTFYKFYNSIILIIRSLGGPQGALAGATTRFSSGYGTRKVGQKMHCFFDTFFCRFSWLLGHRKGTQIRQKRLAIWSLFSISTWHRFFINFGCYFVWPEDAKMRFSCGRGAIFAPFVYLEVSCANILKFDCFEPSEWKFLGLQNPSKI